MSSRNRGGPIRILHVVGGMDTGGVETWLMHVLRRIDRSRFQFDFLVHTTKTCFYDEEIKSLGCKIMPCLTPQRPWLYARNLLRILKEQGPYDVVHSHVHHFTGFTLLVARLAGVQTRIAHSHSDTTRHEGSANLLRKVYLRAMQWLIHFHATKGLACSAQAAVDLYGKGWEKGPRYQILYCGIDLEAFMRPVDRDEVRRELGIPSDAFVLGHVGRFSKPKNHDFLLDVFAEVVHRVPNSCLLLVGDGELREAIKQKAQLLGIAGKVVFAGIRPDIPRLMKGAMDVFVFPSLWEGLPLVILEVQAANLHCVYSENITEEVSILKNLMHPVALNEPVSKWADLVFEMKQNSSSCREKVTDAICRGPFNIEVCLNQLKVIYQSKVKAIL